MNIQKPKFSVIIPVYNKEYFISRSIQSVLKQTFSDYELIIINDASTDNSALEIKKFSNSRISILNRNEPGPGGYAARNLGIMNAQGEWISFLDADDEWHPNHLEELNRHTDNHIDMISCGFITDSGDSFCVDSSKILQPFDALDILLVNRNLMNTNSVAIRKSTLVKAGMFPEGKCRRGGDTDTWLRVILASRTIYASKTITSVYHVQASGVLSNKANLGFCHPLTNTVKDLIKKKDAFSFSERRLLKRLSNRKSLSWFIESKLSNKFNIMQLKNLYPEAFSIRDLKKVSALLLPIPFLKKILSM